MAATSSVNQQQLYAVTTACLAWPTGCGTCSTYSEPKIKHFGVQHLIQSSEQARMMEIDANDYVCNLFFY